MPKIAINKIVVDPTVQIRRANHEPTIRRYEESFDKLPPVVVFDVPGEGRLLADGFHRIAAAERLGRREIDATLRKGTREDVLEFAVIANTKNGTRCLPMNGTPESEDLSNCTPAGPSSRSRTL